MTISITTQDGRAFDAFTSAEVLSSMVRSSECSFEVGDDGSYRDISELAALGVTFSASVDSAPRLKGRVEILNSDLDARRSSTLRFVVRSGVADLESNTAPQSIKVRDVSVRQVVEQVMAKVFPDAASRPVVVYRADASRDLMTGRRTRGGAPAKDLGVIQEKEALPNPGEMAKAFLDRHLMRHGFMIWDGPDGEIVVGAPDDQQEALYYFRCLLGLEGQRNNCEVLGRSRDVTGAPGTIKVFGTSGGKDGKRSKVSALRTLADVVDAGFNRTIEIVDEGIKNKDMAERSAARALSERIRKVETISIETDGHSHEDGTGRIGYAPDTCADCIFETLGGPLGKYYVEQTLAQVSPREGERTQVQLVREGTWSL